MASKSFLNSLRIFPSFCSSYKMENNKFSLFGLHYIAVLLTVFPCLIYSVFPIFVNFYVVTFQRTEEFLQINMNVITLSPCWSVLVFWNIQYHSKNFPFQNIQFENYKIPVQFKLEFQFPKIEAMHGIFFNKSILK